MVDLSNRFNSFYHNVFPDTENLLGIHLQNIKTTVTLRETGSLGIFLTDHFKITYFLKVTWTLCAKSGYIRYGQHKTSEDFSHFLHLNK